MSLAETLLVVHMIFPDYSFSSPHLVVLCPWICCSRPPERNSSQVHAQGLESLYSIGVDEVELGLGHNSRILLQDNLIRASMPGKIYVWDATTIEDRDSVQNSRREITEGLGEEDEVKTVNLFNQFLGVSKQQDTIKYHNYWR